MSDDVGIETAGRVAVIEVQRGPANFFDRDVLRAVADGIHAAHAGGLRAVVLCSAGRHFCAGADFGSTRMHGDRAREAADIYREGIRIVEAELPVVAAVQGGAIGGGLGLACAVDFRVASRASRLHANFAALGFHHGFGLSVTLPRIVGDQKALDLLTTARPVDGEDAHAIGLVDRLAEPGQEREVALELATTLASRAPLAVHSIRQTLRRELVSRVRTALDRELVEQQRLWRTRDSEIGIAAARTRSTPEFVAE